MAAIAYRIKDTGAVGGIVVTPIGFQKGAALVAAAENIIHVKLCPDSTNHSYLLEFLNQIMVGVYDSVSIKESISIEIVHEDGTIERREML